MVFNYILVIHNFNKFFFILCGVVLGTVTGKLQTTEFKFFVEGNAKKFQYVKIKSEEGMDVLAQIVELSREGLKLIADCIILGYRDKGVLRGLRRPLLPGTVVMDAEDEFVERTLGLGKKKDGAYIGSLEGRDKVRVFLDLNKALTKHVCVLAKSGYGKSYTVSVLLEEIIERGVPVLIVDPHGEYSSLKQASDKNLKKMDLFGIEPKGYEDKLIEYSPAVEYNTEAKPLVLNMKNISSTELIHLLPARLSNSQLSALYSIMQDGDVNDFDDLLLGLENSDHFAKWTLISIIQYIKGMNLFSDNPTSLNELIKPGRASILNLRGVNQDVQEVVVYKLINDLFRERKKGNIPPFFLVLEEAHNFLPERNFGEAKSSGILRQVFSEGRKFGLGACLISQRPSRVDKSALSQCTTQVILRVTNPYDLKSIVNSVEGITSETEKEIKNIPVGTAMVVGLVDMPVFVNIRPKRTKHGGEAVDMLSSISGDYGGEVLPVIAGKDVSLDDETNKLIPCVVVSSNGYNLLFNMNTGGLIKDFGDIKGDKLEFDLPILSPTEKKIFDLAYNMRKFSVSEIFAKSGMSFSEVKNTLIYLVNKGYLDSSGASYFLSDYFNVLLNLKDFSFSGKVQFLKVKSSFREKENFSSDGIVNSLKKFVDVKNVKKCWLVV